MHGVLRLVRGGVQRDDLAHLRDDVSPGRRGDELGGSFDGGVQGLQLTSVQRAEVGDGRACYSTAV